MMNDDITLNPEKTDRGMPQMQYQELTMERTDNLLQEQQMQMHAAEGVQCPHCGEMNEPGAIFCASCGQPIGKTTCPNCGAELDPDADFCETCRHYIRKDVCSFCGSHLSGNEAFCPECGSPRGGIVCPVCHTLNDFSFCKQCGTPLTDEAHQLLERMKQMPEFQEMQQLASELQQLDLTIPYSSERELLRDQRNVQLRERVLTLLAQDRGVPNPVIPQSEHKRLSKEEYEAKKKERLDKISAILDKMAQVPQPKPAQVRNYAMACRPQGVRLAWECNFKHALHSSPCGCAKPQMGGKWVILGKNTKKEIKDDK
ncbi:MAG: zinc ribbon domain-containing protein [Prevotella sp.]|nr:zinc ribbon domain-containing protein [Prevotella sp.]